MSMLKRLFVIVILIFVSGTLTSCSKSIAQSNIHLELVVSEGVVFGATDFGETYSVNDNGIFYLKDNKMKFYDHQKKESFVLCNKTSCSHSNAYCSAWYTIVGMQ